MNFKNYLKKLWQHKLLTVLILLSGILIFVSLINLYISKISAPYIFLGPNLLPKSQTALILGSRVYENGEMSDVLSDRTIKAIELYDLGKVEKILVSGDHGQQSYDEVNVVKNYLLEHGIPPEDIFLDHAGFDTYDSLYRAQAIFQIEKLIVVTQEFHLPRAVYIGNQLGIETYGYIADRQPYLAAKWNAFRESLARVKAFINLTFNSEPSYLGTPIPITGDGQLSWD
ncbi:YdcF family protein [Candidatus Peregrinibacteria bacterium]|nr:YdcF family protein [Candidatus Peregrinibacteria bacterium]